MLSDQRTRLHSQLAEWYRRRLLLRLEEEDTQPDDVVQLLDAIGEQECHVIVTAVSSCSTRCIWSCHVIVIASAVALGRL